ncbi:serine-rich adhesin for platelets-like [Octopus sinensis]|uniref:Serine-rich adhesin for platelets-like n=1 Tax=Octopus sinensis TaxID=2607531 RepID=A0A6P7T822_9MOLL|nr:serine-rich adhesin for platelets-like [Octopus sinensis]XP_029646944.1 serine-rich adhesin for platelets-like [Octopus sinensis]XP_036366436.1 serine-rich adhesin for platelets-like [Octopus sinensis]
MKGLESPVKKRARLSLKRREPASEKISPPLLTNLSGGKCKASVDSTNCPAASATQSDGIDNVVTTSTAHAVASMVTSLPRNSSMTNASEAENSWEPSRSKVNSTADVGNDVISINSDDVYESMPIVAALENLDNTCFLNSVLQILRYTPCFVDGLNELCYKVAKHTRSFADSSVESESSRVWELALSISEVFKQMSALERKMQGLSSVTSANIALKPDRVQNVVRKLNSMFEGSSQHDAQEFLQFILYHLQEAEKLLKKASASEANSSSSSGSGNTSSSNSRSNSSSNFNGTASPVSLSSSSENISSTSGTLSTDNSAFVSNKTMVNNSEPSCDGLHLLPPTEIALSPNCSISPDVIVRSYSLDDLSSTLHTSSSSSQKTSESALTDQCPAAHQSDKTSDFKTNLLKHQCVSSLDDANSVSEFGTSTLTKLQSGLDSSSHNSHTNGISSVGGTRVFSAEDTKLSSTEDSKSASVEDVKSSSVVDKKSTSVKDKKCVSEEGSKSASVEGVKHVSVVDSKCASLKDTNCISMEYTNCTSEDDTKCIIVEDKKSTFKKDRDCILSRGIKFVQVDDTQDIYMEDISDKKLVPVENPKSNSLDNMKDSSALKEVTKPTCETDARQVRGEDMLLKNSSSSSSFILTPPLTPLSAKCFTIEAAVTNGKIGVNGPLSVGQYSSKATHPTPLLSQSQASPSSSAPVPHCHSASAPLPPSTLSPCLSPPPPLLENSCHSPGNCPTIQTTASVTATDNTINSATATTTTTSTTITTTSTNTNATDTNTASTTTTTTTTTANANNNNNNSHTYSKNNNKKTKSKNTVSLHNGMSKNQVRQIWNSFVKLEKCDLVCNSALSSVNVYYAIECLNTGNSLKKKKDFVKQLFLGTILSRTRCLECEKSSEKPEEFLEVSVPLKKTSNPLRNSDGESSDPENEDSSDQNTLISFISSFSEVEKLQGDNKYYCDSCYNYVEADRSLHYDTLPDILTVHLKRFSASSEIGLMCKINDHVDIPLSLPCLLYKCPKDCYRQDHRYSLFGMITHAGYTISSGHYVAYVKTFAGSLTWHFPPNGGQRESMPVNSAASCRSSYSDSHSDGDIFWLECDDSSVRVFTEEDFLERLSSEGLLTGTPYLLFYHRSPMKRS